MESVKASAPATRIEVTLTDDLKIEPAAMTVPAGVPVTFVVTNSGTILHEFVLGDEAEQTAHEAEMAAAGGMSMPRDEDMAVGVEPGRTKELTVTFDEPGMVLAGCHVVGHYAAGMKAAVTIE
ncbi:MAG TPA: plastocyanin/azurin family copper-binding protein [Candidatus Limnocylindrales bacterium]